MEANEIAKALSKAYPNPKSELIHSNEFEFFVAVCLSAQTTDKKVNQVTSGLGAGSPDGLFKKYKSWRDLASADLRKLQKDIHGVNFHLGKAERLIKAAQFILSDFGGKLPHKLDQLIKIPGVARKSANVIQQELWGEVEGIVVDTHISRVSQRLGLTKNTDPVKIERDLMQAIPKKYWKNYSCAVVLHGRYVCVARRPLCEKCVLAPMCPSAGGFMATQPR